VYPPFEDMTAFSADDFSAKGIAVQIFIAFWRNIPH
jgi:hypothetical protein